MFYENAHASTAQRPLDPACLADDLRIVPSVLLADLARGAVRNATNTTETTDATASVTPP
jgi:hypothetical protein